jgi:deferrochelatase/peroxidase EfeB
MDLDDIQRLVVQGYVEREWSAWYLLRVENKADARTWINNHIARVGTANAASRALDKANKEPRLAIAVTFRGLQELGLTAAELSGFPAPFTSGMEPGAIATLGDDGDSDPQHWLWGSGAKVPHLLVVLYSAAANKNELLAQGRQLGLPLPPPNPPTNGMSLIIPSVVGGPQAEDHFGFRDGIAQPLIEGSGTSRLLGVVDDDPNLVRPGEFVIGYRNQAGQIPASPTVPANRGTGLPPDPADESLLDFGRNGSYLVVRQLEQHVTEFTQFINSNRTTVADRNRLAAKLVGRWKSGAPLVLAEDADDPDFKDANDFMYYATDRNGYSCPIGSHIRRANPRDSLVDRVPGQTPAKALRESNAHRLIRRGRTYIDGTTKGLMFACLNANIETQFEFVQQTWITSPSFGGLTGEDDPLVGGRSRVAPPKFTIQRPGGVDEELDGLAPFVTVRGGEYFFMPSIAALKFLAALH